MYDNIYEGKTVLVTGHTGFKGAWLALWLHKLGANVIGFSLNKDLEQFPNNLVFDSTRLKNKIIDLRGDLKDFKKLELIFKEHQPDFVFHLAAQPIVRLSYQLPHDTFLTNVLGTLNILECIKASANVKSALIITTDKVYSDKDCWQGYKETDPLGGYGDPYSCSKACAEIIVDSYRKSFFIPENKLVATVRAGNVLGGGDYGENRIVPDCVNSLIKSETISVRNPHSTRPWQYILDVLNGYLLIGQKLLQQDHSVATSWNIGPLLPSVITVKKLVEEIIYNWGSGSWEDVSKIGTLEEIKKEAKLLNLDISKAYFEIGFRPQYNIKETIAKTVNWYKNYNENNAYDLCLEEINHFEKKMKINVVESQTEEPMMDERKQSIITENESVENINHYSEIKKCRYCHGSNIKMFLDYGMMPLVNNLLSSESNCNHDPKFPLNLYFCKSCGLVQIGSIVHPEKMFSNYLYFSSTSSTFCQHGFDFASLMKTRFNLDNNSFVVEIASNDGAVLKSFKELGIPFLGVDPAENIVKLANEKGIKTKCAYFNSKIAEEIAVDSGKADLIYGMNVFAHIPEIHDFVLGVKKILKDNGVIVIEAPYIIDFIKKVEFDTVYHEHVNYLGLHAMTNLFKQFDLELFDAQWVDIHGGSMRYFFCKRGIQRISENVHHFLNSEKEAGLFNEQTYLDFAQKVFNLKEDLLILLQKLKSQGKKIVAYAASAKGIVLLNYCGIGGDYIDFVVDKSVYKQNHFIPGVNLEIKDPKLILDEQPDYILLLAWNFKKEIMAEQKEYLAKGGKFIIPIPTPLIESGNTLQEQQEDKER